jgi:hypothetical protein
MVVVPSEKWGGTPIPLVILRQPGTVMAEELCHWINERVDSKNQRFHGVTILDDFPRVPPGKTLKSILREPYWTGRDEKI